MDDWRLNGQEEYLYKARLQKKKFESAADSFYHEHCDFCYAKFSNYDEDLHWGYYFDKGNYHDFWICDTCYNDFKVQFEWTVDLSAWSE